MSPVCHAALELGETATDLWAGYDHTCALLESGGLKCWGSNLRREYFRVTLDEVRAAVAAHHGAVTFVTTHAAEEYRKSIVLRDGRTEQR